jgi:hypothetical protein
MQAIAVRCGLISRVAPFFELTATGCPGHDRSLRTKSMDIADEGPVGFQSLSSSDS